MGGGKSLYYNELQAFHLTGAAKRNYIQHLFEGIPTLGNYVQDLFCGFPALGNYAQRLFCGFPALGNIRHNRFNKVNKA